MRYLMTLILCIGCGSTQEPVPSPTTEPTATEAQAAASCNGFRFALGEYVETESAEPTEEVPVSLSAGTQPLTIHFVCDGTSQQASLGDLAASCQGAGCGSEITVRDGTVETSDPDEVLTAEETQAVTAGTPTGAVHSWWFASNVNRGLVEGDTFDVIETPSGFSVVRRETSETVYTHP